MSGQGGHRAIWRTLDGRAPKIIAHRGASGLLPEHTLAAYALGLAQGADIIEPDLVPSADGVLFCRHEPLLARSTDIGSRPDLASRSRDGDWPSIELTAAEIDQLRAVQPFAGRDRSHDGRHAVPRFSALIQWAADAAIAGGRELLLYPEIKHPAAFAAAGHDPLPQFTGIAGALPNGVRLAVQCFDAAALRRIYEATGLPCTLLLDATADPLRELDRHHEWLAALGVDKRLLWRDDAPSSLVAAAHEAGLRVDAWTYRDDQPAEMFVDIDRELRATMQLGVDGLFCDFPATAVAVRAALAGD